MDWLTIPRSSRLARWALGAVLVATTACGRTDFQVSASGVGTDTTSGTDATDSLFTDSADTTETDSVGDFTDTFEDTGRDCGNGVAEPGESCDGLDLAGQTCVSLGFGGGTLACTAGCEFDTLGCVGASCGNGVLDPGESCDGFDLGGETCVSLGFDGGFLACAGNCTFDTGECFGFVCGNDVTEPGELCDGFDTQGLTCEDFGFDGGTLSCNEDCDDFDLGDCFFAGGDCCTGNGTPGCEDPACQAEICAADPFCCSTEWDDICGDLASGGQGDLGCLMCTCGNGTLDAAIEACDGSDLGGETCVSLGFDGGMLACNPDCLSFDLGACVVNQCGNNVIEGTEVCDGAALGGQSCVSLGFDGGTLGCAADCSGFDTTACFDLTCGNNVIEGAEVCDGADLGGQSCVSLGFDGGTLGCLGNCSDFDTTGCFTCGNAVIEGAEVCDSANLNGQSCVSLGFAGGNLGCLGDCSGFDTGGCVISACSNDIIEGAEVCDGTDLDGLDCIALGFTGGTLSCLGDCSAFDTSGCTAGDDCCVANGTPGCGNATCEAEICAINPSCCIVDWDAMCADIATGIDGGGNECLTCTCGNGVTDGNETCDGADLDGQSCVSLGFAGGALGCLGNCGAFDTSGCSGGGGGCGNDMVDGLEVCDGTDLDGQDCTSFGFTGGTLACTGDCSMFDTSACVNANGDCCTANGSPGCVDPTCSAAICAIDDSCCNVAWDAMCADMANGSDGMGNECDICGFGCPHSPCQNGDEMSVCQMSNMCVAAICAIDPFCCSTSWDGICVNEVATDCGLICP